MVRGTLPLFDNKSPRTGEPFDRFLQMLGALINCISILHFHLIRYTGYGVIAEKPRVNHLPEIFRALCRNKKLS